MTTRATPMTHPSQAARSPGFFRNLVYWLLDLDDEATLQAGLRRMRSTRGYFASLPPEALAYSRIYDGPENLGPLTKPERHMSS